MVTPKELRPPPKPLPVVLVVATGAVTCDVVSTALDGVCAVLAATTLRAARDVARARPPSITILDGDLPLPGRAALIDELRAANAKVGFIVIEPTIAGPGTSQLVELGPRLARPVHPGQILEAVRGALDGKLHDPVEDLLVRVHRSRTTRFER